MRGVLSVCLCLGTQFESPSTISPRRKKEGQQNGALLLNMGEYAYRHSTDDNTGDVLGKVLALEFG